LIVVAVFARGGLLPGPRPCISIGEASVQVADLPWQAQLHVSFTDDPARATVRVQITGSAAAADFAVVDDVDSPEAGACEANAATKLVAISASPAADAPVIYLSQEGPADYRIFVRSKTFSVRDAAALMVGAGGGHRRLAAASL
jgi:nanoRNase/pAp phosphatase (c-di-AMP/oligoRNAs hydrolase)